MLLRELGLGATAQAIMEAKTLITIIVVWVAFSLIDLARQKGEKLLSHKAAQMRILDNTLVSIPNCIIVHGTIKNFSAREEMLYHPALPLRYDTSTEQLQLIIDAIEEMAAANPKVKADTIRVRFTEFTENAMTIKARIYID